MAKEELFPNLTLRENLSLPLTFRTIEKKIRDEIIDKALSEQGLMEVANKFGRYLTEDEKKKSFKPTYTILEDLSRIRTVSKPLRGKKRR